MTNRKEKYSIFIILLLILSSGSLIVKTIGDNYFYLLNFTIITLLVAQTNKKNINNLNVYLIIVIVLGLHAVLHFSAIKSYIGVIIRITSVFLLSLAVQPNKYWRYYCEIIYYISVFSLIGIFVINYFPYDLISILSRKLILYDPSYAGKLLYNNLLIITWPINYGGGIIRNQSVFWEPGAFQMFVNLALLINLKFDTSKINKKNIIYFITVISTFSTTGYIILVLIFFDNVNWKRVLKFRVKYLILLGLLMSIIFLILNSRVVKGKFDINNPTYKSFNRRIIDTTVSINILKNNLLLGIGYGDKSIEYINQKAFLYYGITSGGGSNHFLTLLGQWGIIIGFIYFFPLFNASTYTKYKILYISIILIFLSTENFSTSYIILSLIYFEPHENYVIE